MQFPAPAMWTVAPPMLQSPLAAKLTARLEEADAETLKSASPNVLSAKAANVIVWAALAAATLRLTSPAAL